MGLGPIIIWLPKTAGPYSLMEVTTLVLGRRTPVLREKPGAINEDTDTDSVILHSKDEDEPPPLLRVYGVIDWQKQKNGNENINKDRVDLKIMGYRPFINWGNQI